jgi:SAM-dependent methyltransferase
MAALAAEGRRRLEIQRIRNERKCSKWKELYYSLIPRKLRTGFLNGRRNSKNRATVASPPDPFVVTFANAAARSVTGQSGSGRMRPFERRRRLYRSRPTRLNIDIFDSGTTDVLGSAMALPFLDSSADLVVLQGVIEHVEDAAGRLRNPFALLRPGGLFYTEMPFLRHITNRRSICGGSTKPGLATLCGAAG